MKYDEAKEKFIQTWGSMGSTWGVSRTMSQIHAYLLTLTEETTADEIMEGLGLSRGNVSMSLKSLQEWGLVYKTYKAGERKEFFTAEKDIYRIAMQITKERKKRELDPMIQVLEQLKDFDTASNDDKDSKEFKKVVSDILSFAKKSDRMLNTFVLSEKSWFTNFIAKMFK